MNSLEQRAIIYLALVLLCILVTPVTGVAAVSWSFLQVVTVIELTYWFGPTVGQRSTGLSTK